MFILLILLFYLLVLPSLSYIKCSQQCSELCSVHQLSCVVCLAKYYQSINSTTLQCDCLQDFKPFQNFNITYCCPKWCRSCDLKGCSSCWTSGSVVYNLTLKANTCQCQDNYFMDANGICQCSSKESPGLYYWDSVFQKCLVCPKGCICDQNGCSVCSSITNRKVVKYQSLNLSTCYCANGFQEYNGVCICPDKCNCTKIRNSACSPQSHRYNSTGNWKCKYPYVETGKACVCSLPYQQIMRPDGIKSCECKSYSSPTLYYKYLQVCYICFPGCFCDHNGCCKCEAPGTVSINYNCFCNNNYTQTKNGCQCIFPNYFFQIDQGVCHCLSDLNNTQYYFSKSDGKCKMCPNGCMCNQNGCIQCNQNSLRFINKLSDDEYICECMQNTEETLEGICKCHIFLKLVNHSCICETSLPSLIFADSDTKICISCPVGCECNEIGCFKCTSLAFRQISANSFGIHTCYCKINFIQIQTNVYCVCNFNFTFNSLTKQCQCKLPYYLNEEHQCVCSSETDPIKYFYDLQFKKCSFCPFNCKCTDQGCVECNHESMRVSILDIISFSYVCRCIQTSFLVGNYCTICSNNSFYYAGACVQCLNCQTCDSRGCLSCNDTIMTLNDFSCECIDTQKYNTGGQCLCEIGYHRDTIQKTDSCVRCPLWCATCTDNEIMQCLLCPDNVYRTNSPSRNCQCIQGYIEAFPQQQYCCHQSCDSCNITQCLTCPEFSYRQVDNSKCGCVFPFIEINKGACVCNDSFYLLNGICFKCPQSCKTCIYIINMTYIQCTSCYDEMNRNLSDINCSCLPGYYQSKPIQSEYCILLNCLHQIVNCTSCILDRIVTNQGCVCPPGKFQNYLRTCQECNITGCLQCQQYLLCYNCDIQNSYYLSNLRCYYYNNSAVSMVGYVGSRRIFIQHQLHLDLDQYIGLGLSMIRIEQAHDIQTYQPIILDIDYFNINDDMIMTYFFQNLYETYTNVLISLNISYTTNTNSTLKFFQQNIYLQLVFGRSLMQNFIPSPATFASFAGTIIFTICSYILYVIGFKHNNIVFYIQTISFMAFVIDDNVIVNIVFLYNLRYSYFNYDANPFWRLIPLDYIENCPRNYHITSLDCNIVRNIGLALLIALVSWTLIAIFRFSHFFISAHYRLDIKFIYYKKFIYRSLEFFVKTTMFPLLFFSIQTLLNTQGYVLIDSDFKQKCIIISSIIILLYVIHAFVEVYFNIMSKMYKVQNFFEFIGAILMSFIIILSKGTAWLALGMIIILLKSGIYCILRIKYMKQSQAYLMMIPSIGSSICILLAILKANRITLIVVHVINCFLFIIINFLLTRWFLMMGKFDKIQQKVRGQEIIEHFPVVQTQSDVLCTIQSLVSIEQEEN